MRFTTAGLLILAAAASFLLQIEWLFLTLVVFALVAVIAESSSPQEVPKAFREREEKKRREVIVVPHSSAGTEFYNNLITNIVTDVLKKKN